MQAGVVGYIEPMAILKVARLGHPVLRKVAEPVAIEGIKAPQVQRFIDDLIETMVEYDGAGLAAPQVHVSQQIVVFEVQGNPRYPDAESIPLTVLINPKITAQTKEVDEDWEGCLSVPDLRGKVPRFTQVKVEAYDRQGKKLNYAAKGFEARVVQHECDHLLGKVFLDRMTSMESLSFVKEFMRYQMGKPGEKE
ncbi:MAG TPA: peptide deformylase [Candidatus Acidoferrales bacterium]|nr:peptide deformylase [Candidatus Acidoferrales bacterium]